MERESFLERLRSADEDRKKRWLIVSTAVVMGLVIFVWLKYFNTLVRPSNPSLRGAEQEQSFSFRESLEQGAALLFRGFLDRMRDLGAILNAPRSYIVTPPGR